MMMMTDAKGKTYMVDTSTKKSQAECEKMAMCGVIAPGQCFHPAGRALAGYPSMLRHRDQVTALFTDPRQP
jgi:hypothetical protein